MAVPPTATLERNFRGRLIRPTDQDYDSARALYNGMIDKRPGLIARCVDVADVIAAVNFSREHGLLLAIRGGGHNGPGLGSGDGGLVIDLSSLKGVRVDPARRTVRVEPGCTSGDVDHATHPFGLAVPFGIRLDNRHRRAHARRRHRIPHARFRPHHSTTCWKRMSSWPTATSSRPARASTPICSGPCAAAAATSASSRASSSRRIR